MHLLVDVDSTIPNLALMKISRYVKNKGQMVDKIVQMKGRDIFPLEQSMRLGRYGYSDVWISTIFTWNRHLAERIVEYCNGFRTITHVGGTGFSDKAKLPDEIEDLMPDYSLYGDDRAVGYTQRGCPLGCKHCIVPGKEGKLSENPYVPLERWVPEGFKKILLLDNNLSMSPHEFEVLDTCKNNGWKLSITQGYNIRTMTEEKAKRLAEHKPYDLKFKVHRFYIAWDYYAIGPAVEKGLEMLIRAGFKGSDIMCYCLVGYNTSHLQDYHRFHILWKKYGVQPFLMRYNLRRDDKFLNALARYTNRGPANYRNHDFLAYCDQPDRTVAPAVRAEAEKVVDWVESGRPVPLDIPYQMPAMSSLYA